MRYPKLQLPVRFYLAGCSQSGKSSLLKAMIDHQAELFERSFTRIIIARRAVDELHLALQRAYPDLVELVTGMPMEFLDSIEEQVRPGDNILLIFDDLISVVAESRDAENAFYVSSSKFGVSIVLTSQNIFHRSTKLRNISLNCNLIGLTQNLRDATQVASLARQLYPENPQFLVDAYHKTMRLKPFNYLLINLQPLCDDRLRVVTGILPYEDRIYWLPKKRFGGVAAKKAGKRLLKRLANATG
jgi:hypothetical protein